MQTKCDAYLLRLAKLFSSLLLRCKACCSSLLAASVLRAASVADGEIGRVELSPFDGVLVRLASKTRSVKNANVGAARNAFGLCYLFGAEKAS